MQAQLTEFLLRLTFQQGLQRSTFSIAMPQNVTSTSQEILINIHNTLNSQKNFKIPGEHKSSFCSEESTSQSPMKCNCKKSKCLKLYCQCFSKGSFCKNCNCEGCQNKEQFSDIRARAIDEMMIKTPTPFGYKSLSMKGCTCRKTGCQKKYCECYNQGLGCSQYCKCVNCENPSCL